MIELDGLQGTTVPFIRAGLHELNCEFSSSKNIPNCQNIIMALNGLFGDEISQTMAQVADWIDILNRLHLRMYRYSFSEDLSCIFSNGYQLLLILIGADLANPLIFQTIVIALCRYLSRVELVPVLCTLLKYCIEVTYRLGKGSNISEQGVRIISALDSCLERIGDEPSQSMATTCISLVLELLDKYALETNDKNSFLISLIILDPANSIYQSLLSPFKYKRNVFESSLLWIKHFQPTHGYTTKPFKRISNLLDSVDSAQDKTRIREYCTSFLENRSNSFTSSSSNDLDLIVTAAKTYVFNSGQRTLSQGYAPHLKFGNFGESNYDGYTAAIQMLFPYLANQDLQIVSLCVKAFDAILSSEEGTNALVSSGEHIHSYLASWKTKTIIPAPRKLFSILTLESEENEEAVWLSNISCAMLAEFDFPFIFRYLAPLLEKSPEFASSMLPILFHYRLSVEQRDGLSLNSESLTKRIVKFLVPHNCISKNLISFKHLLGVIKVSSKS